MIALRILARSIVRELMKREYGLRHTIALASELLGLACESIRSTRTPTARQPSGEIDLIC